MTEPTIEKIKKVKCPIFQSRNEDITKITKAVNEAEDVEKKAHLAERLVSEAEELLSCEHFEKKRAECRICRYVARLRKNTAELIIEAKELRE